tara:strand:- start:6360 stop:8087 length:1728 start_codon:yes stop_codon:yes gene_type:complete
MDKNLFQIVKNYGYKSLSIIFTLLLVNSILELMVIGSIIPFAAVMVDPENIKNIKIINLIYETLNFQNNTNFIIFLGIVFFLINLTLNFYGILSKYIIEKKVWKQYRHVSLQYFFNLFDKNVLELEKKNLSEQYAKILSELAAVFNVQVNAYFEIISKIISIIIITSLLIFINYKITILALVFSIIIFFIFYYILKNKINALGKNQVNLNRNRINTIIQIFNSIREIKLYKNTNFFFNYDLIFKKFMKNAISLSILQKAPRYFLEPLFLLLVLSIIFFMNIYDDLLNFLPILGVFIYSTLRILPAVNAIIASSNSINSYRFSLNEIYPDIKNISFKDNFVTRQNTNDDYKITDIIEQIKFDGVKFEFPNQQFNCEFSFSIYKNRKYTIIGGNGSGKSTLVNIFLGIIRPQSGNIIINKTSYKHLDFSTWQEQISFVPQRIYLLEASLRQNITFNFKDNYTDEKLLEKALHISNIDLTNFPINLESKIYENGKNLSGGQIQKIAIARAVYRNAKIMVLDEALSSIDFETKKIIQNRIDNNDHTVIQVSHDLQALKNDEIIKISNGKIIFEGLYKDS